jgi:site-specific recombinase XerC
MGTDNRVLPALTPPKIQGLCRHDLRHTSASRVVITDVDLRTVQELLGHKTITVTERYLHLSPAGRGIAAERVAADPRRAARRCGAAGSSGWFGLI